MLIPIAEAFEELADVAEAKVASIRAGLPRFLLGAALAGAAVGAAVVFLLMVSAPLLATQHPFGRLVQASAFGVGLALAIFVGAELSTSGVMTQSLGYLRRRIDAADAAFAWLAAAVGNLVGAVVLALLVDGAGIFTSGTPANQPPVFQAAVGALSLGIGDLSGGQLVLRAALCNLLVCTAIFIAVRVQHDGAKLLVLWAAVAAFVAAGLEYSIANMALLSFAALSDVGTWSDLTRNLTFTVPGNIVGGLVFVGLVHGVRRVRTVGEEPAAVASDPEPLVPPTAMVAEPTPAEKAPAKKAPAKKAPARKAPAKKLPAKKLPAKKAPARSAR